MTAQEAHDLVRLTRKFQDRAPSPASIHRQLRPPAVHCLNGGCISRPQKIAVDGARGSAALP